MHHHFARQHARHAAEQHAAAAVMFCEKIAAHEHAHAPGDFAHRFQQRQAAVHLDGFVGDAGRALDFSSASVSGLLAARCR